MSASLSEEEIKQIKASIVELELEHRDLNQLIEQLVRDPSFEELHIKRLKKRKLQLKDQMARLENDLIPDFLA
ncbi:MAG: YdcH family protein [Gammaproteobacteria bacterium]|nr:YdcH family protein [Gammaproteobacteria bacterium]